MTELASLVSSSLLPRLTATLRTAEESSATVLSALLCDTILRAKMTEASLLAAIKLVAVLRGEEDRARLLGFICAAFASGMPLI